MGHLYQKLGRKIDGLAMRAPWNETFHTILKELYTDDEAAVVIGMPYSMSEFETIRKATGIEPVRLQNTLDSLCAKGLVIDLCLGGVYRYMAAPMVIGIYEFTMMRTGEGVDRRKIAGLFRDYFEQGFQTTNFSGGKVGLMRALPWEDTVATDEYVEILDYDRAVAICEDANRFSIGICSCRHERHHLGDKKCDVELEKCSSFGFAADYLIRNNLAREASRTEMLENIARSKEQGLVLNADNVNRSVSYICHCCSCCCNVLKGIRDYGCTSLVVTSGYVARVDEPTCDGCGRCARTCAVNALKMQSVDGRGKKKLPVVNDAICLGCGICSLKCKTGAIKLTKTTKKAIRPEDTFERVLLQCLEKGTLQNQLFSDPNRMTHSFMRGLVGGILRLEPVKQAILSDSLRSTFLRSMRAGTKAQGKGWMDEL